MKNLLSLVALLLTAASSLAVGPISGGGGGSGNVVATGSNALTGTWDFGATTLTLPPFASPLVAASGGTAKAYDTVNGAETTVASATTTDLGAVTSNHVSITGTTTITGFGTVAAGTIREGRFTGALTLTHNATSLIIPGAANVTTAAGDRFKALSLGSGNWCVYDYTKANGHALVETAGGGGLGYNLHVAAGGGSFNPSSSTVYYIGDMASLNGQSFYGATKIFVPKTGTLKGAYLSSISNNTAGSNESWSMYVRLNDTTDTLIQATSSSSALRSWTNSSLSIAVTAGDTINIKFTGPAWGTPPTNLYLSGILYIE